MNDLRELIGKEVTAYLGEDLSIKAKVLNVLIDDYYFQEKGEQIYITLNLEPMEDMGEDFPYEDLCSVPLSNIFNF